MYGSEWIDKIASAFSALPYGLFFSCLIRVFNVLSSILAVFTITFEPSVVDKIKLQSSIGRFNRLPICGSFHGIILVQQCPNPLQYRTRTTSKVTNRRTTLLSYQYYMSVANIEYNTIIDRVIISYALACYKVYLNESSLQEMKNLLCVGSYHLTRSL